MFAFIPTLFGMTARVTHPGHHRSESGAAHRSARAAAGRAWRARAGGGVLDRSRHLRRGAVHGLDDARRKDIYQRHFKPDASDAHLLLVARIAAVVAGAAGVVLSIYLGTVSRRSRSSMPLLGVTFFVPILGGLYLAARQRSRRRSPPLPPGSSRCSPSRSRLAAATLARSDADRHHPRPRSPTGVVTLIQRH